MRIKAGPWRLAVARALTSPGWLRAGVSSEPDLYTWRLDGGEGSEGSSGEELPGAARRGAASGLSAPGFALVVASDGVWGALSNADAARLVAGCWGRGAGAQAAAEALCCRAGERGSADNLSACVVYLGRPGAGAGAS